MPLRNRGIALFISLVLLLILTLIGVSAVQTTTLESRMVRNDYDRLRAFQAAEHALRDGERFVEGIASRTVLEDGLGCGAPAGDGRCSVGMWRLITFAMDPTPPPPPWDVDSAVEDLWTDDDLSVPVPAADFGVAQPPRYLVEHVATVRREDRGYQIEDPYGGGEPDSVDVFRVTAIGFGASEEAGVALAPVLLQSTYGRILD